MMKENVYLRQWLTNFFSLAVLAMCCLLPSQCGGTTYQFYLVRPNTTVGCRDIPGHNQHCITLSDIVANSTAYLTSNTVVHFLPGEHKPNQSGWLVVQEGASNVTIAGILPCDILDTDLYCKSTIKCGRHTIGFASVNNMNFQLKDLQILECGHTLYDLNIYWNNIPQSDPNLVLLTLNTINLRIEHMYIKSRTSVGFRAVNPRGYTNISGVVVKASKRNHVTFMSNTGGETILRLYHSSVTIERSSFLPVNEGPAFCRSIQCNKNGGLTIIVSKGYENEIGLNFNNCYFYNGYGSTGGGISVEFYGTQTYRRSLVINGCTIEGGYSDNGGGMYIGFDRESQINPDIDVVILNTHFLDNVAQQSGGAVMIQSTVRISILINGCKFTNNSALSGSGGAVYIDSRFIQSVHIDISRCLVDKNMAGEAGGGVYILSELQQDMSSLSVVSLKESSFLENLSGTGSALFIDGGNEVSSVQTIFSRNKNKVLFSENSIETKSTGAVHLRQIGVIRIYNSSVIKNNGSGIYIEDSTAILKGVVQIEGNNGSGMFIYCNSSESSLRSTTVELSTENTSVCIVNNTAQRYGGGIRISDSCDQQPECFYQIRDDRRFVSLIGLNQIEHIVKMENNIAGLAGSSIYGGNLEQCHIRLNNSDTVRVNFELFTSIFDIDNINSPSAIGSQVYRVCICNQDFAFGYNAVCHHKLNITTFPGANFNVSVLAVGQYNYTSEQDKVLITATILNNSRRRHSRFGMRHQSSQDVEENCTNLTYSLATPKMSVRMKLDLIFPEQLQHTKTQRAIVNIRMLACPFGFELNDNNICDCVHAEIVRCDINTQTIYRSESMWIGNFSGGLAIHKNCPFHFCNINVLELDPLDLDKQCSHNRSGILCGSCRTGFSLKLGSSPCLKCSNIYLLLLVPFAMAGIGLIVLLLMCNLTVSTGTINGLIFYANIIQANKNIFIPRDKIYGSQYIAWLNLDLGFDTCFANGLDAYIKTWLQFVFPIYIWLLVGLLILVSKYSTRVSNLTGSNTVPVLATLFLLSYAKLLRTIVPIFLNTHLIVDNFARRVWLMDGNFLYLGWPHVLLFCAGILTLVGHLLPFTILLLLSPYLQRKSQYRILRWVNQLKPLLDAYQGPYKIKYSYWTGLMLVVRLLLLLVAVDYWQSKPKISLLIISITIIVLLILWIKAGGVYKAKTPNVLEVFYLSNLLIYSITTLYLFLNRDEGVKRRDLDSQINSYVMLGSALVVFICVLVYHCCIQLIKTKIGATLITKFKKKYRRVDLQEETDIDNRETADKVPTVSYFELRESLLEDSVH